MYQYFNGLSLGKVQRVFQLTMSNPCLKILDGQKISQRIFKNKTLLFAVEDVLESFYVQACKY